MAATSILMVEDDEEQANLFGHVLRRAGYAVEIAGDAEAAQARLIAASRDLLLADWDLAGGMNGDALIAWAKARYPGLTTILFSNHPEVEEVAAACGADAAYRKIDGIVKLRQLLKELTHPG